MEYRRLGKSGLEVSALSLGAEHLEHADLATTREVVELAMDHGINYVDLFMATPDVRDHFGTVLQGKRERMHIAGHLGSALTDDGQYTPTRERQRAKDHFFDLLRRLHTDYVDVLFLHYVDEMEDLDNHILAPGGLLELAQELRQQGHARAIAMSSHTVPPALKIVKTGALDALMFPVNPAFDRMRGDENLGDVFDQGPNALIESHGAAHDRRELFLTCQEQQVGVVAMKPYGGGMLLSPDRNPGLPLTPVQCLHYALSQPGVSCVVPGCRNRQEMEAALAYLTASDADKDYAQVVASYRHSAAGACTYCNHCLPCPAGIDIAAIHQLYHEALYVDKAVALEAYGRLEHVASDCIACGQCAQRCPFQVDVVANMEACARLLEQ